MTKVTSAEMQRKFGQFKEVAQREPVTITSHGRDSLVLISVQEFQRLKALDTRQAYYAWELPEDLSEELDQAVAPAADAQYDRELES